MSTLDMYDSVTVSTVPAHPQAVAGYVGGWWPTYYPLVAKFPSAKHLSIAVNAGENARCLDVESGDATPGQAPGWFKRMKSLGEHMPVIYCSVSQAFAVIGAMGFAGIKRDEYLLWTAHYTHTPHICSKPCGYGDVRADATQWTDRSHNSNLDESLCSEAFFGVAIKPVDPHLRFPTGPFAYTNSKGKTEQLNERELVRLHDKYRDHPWLNRYKLHYVNTRLKFLRDRIKWVASQDCPVSWGVDYRGWRWQQLNDRLNGG